MSCSKCYILSDALPVQSPRYLVVAQMIMSCNVTVICLLCCQILMNEWITSCRCAALWAELWYNRVGHVRFNPVFHSIKQWMGLEKTHWLCCFCHLLNTQPSCSEGAVVLVRSSCLFRWSTMIVVNVKLMSLATTLYFPRAALRDSFCVCFIPSETFL